MDRSLSLQSGFSLLELLVVLMIIGVMSAVAIPRVAGSLGNLTLKTSARHVAAIFRHARSQAVSRQLIYRVAIDAKAGSMSVGPEIDHAQTEQDNDIKIRPVVFKLPDQVRFADVQLRGEQNDSQSPCLLFFPLGSSTGGELRLASTDAPGYRITVDLITGTTTLKEIDG